MIPPHKPPPPKSSLPVPADQSQRIDKWLWAARFYKTRSLAAHAVAGGKVHVDQERVKPARKIRVGTTLEIRRGPMLWEVRVLGLSDQRRPAKEAANLYEETEESMARREAAALERKARNEEVARGFGRPTKRERRDLDRIKGRAG